MHPYFGKSGVNWGLQSENSELVVPSTTVPFGLGPVDYLFDIQLL